MNFKFKSRTDNKMNLQENIIPTRPHTQLRDCNVLAVNVYKKCSNCKSALGSLVQKTRLAMILHKGGERMKKPRIPCPTCGSEATYKLQGPINLSGWCVQQRFECQDCGQRFLTIWTGEMVRCYDRRPLQRRGAELCEAVTNG